MRAPLVLLCTLPVLLLAGCPVRSLQPLFTDKDVVFNETLLGTWQVDRDIYILERSGGKGYRITWRQHRGDPAGRDVEDTSYYEGQLGKLGRWWFMDTYSAMKNENYYLLPSRLILKVQIGKDTLRMAPLEGDWLNKMIDGKQLSTPHAYASGSKDDVVLTGTTEELKRLVTRAAADEMAFSEPGIFLRMH